MAARMTRRQFVFGAAELAALGVVTTACGSGGAGSSGSIQFWEAFNSTDVQKYFSQNTIDAYNKSHSPKVELVIKQIDTLPNLLKTAVAAGHGPDIIVEDGPAQALSYVNAGDLLALDSYAAKYNWAQKLLPWALETGKVKGKLYSVPNSYETLALFYNPKTFSDHGWTVPTSRADFESICTDAQGKGIMPLAVGNADWVGTTEWFVTIFFNSFAGPSAVYQGLQGKIKWSDPVFVDAMTLLNSYFQKGWFGGGTQNYFTNKRATLDAKLASGDAAMDLNGSWAVAEYAPYFGSKAGNDATWDWAEIPSFSSSAPVGVYNLSVGGTFSVNKKSKVADGAASLLNWMLSDAKAQGAALAAVAQEPFPVKLSTSDFPANVDKRVERMYVNLAAAKNIGYTTWTFWPPKSDTYIYTEMDKVIAGKTTVQDYLTGLDAVFQPEFKAGLVPPLPAPAST
jgi:raffinose/stachyose/melibiose transport system substrate-binding protein